MIHHDRYPNHSVPPARHAGRNRRTWADRFGLNVLRQRWSNAMPKFFKRVCWLSALVGGTALAVNTAITSGGGTAHDWWNDIYPYLIGIPAGAAFVAKFTQNYDRDGNPLSKSLPEATKPDAVNMSDIETVSATQHPDTTNVGRPAPADIEPYNED